MVWMVAGRLFHNVGAGHRENAPFELRPASADRVVEERSWRTFESGEANREVPKTIADIDLAVE